MNTRRMGELISLALYKQCKIVAYLDGLQTNVNALWELQ